MLSLWQDIELKVDILEWLSTCIESQPGVIELFLCIEFADAKAVGQKVMLFLFCDFYFNPIADICDSRLELEWCWADVNFCK